MNHFKSDVHRTNLETFEKYVLEYNFDFSPETPITFNERPCLKNNRYMCLLLLPVVYSFSFSIFLHSVSFHLDNVFISPSSCDALS